MQSKLFFWGGGAQSHHREVFSSFLFYRFITQVELCSLVKRFLAEGVINFHSIGVKFSSFLEKWFCCFWCINVVLETHCPPLCSSCCTSTALKIGTNNWFVVFCWNRTAQTCFVLKKKKKERKNYFRSRTLPPHAPLNPTKCFFKPPDIHSWVQLKRWGAYAAFIRFFFFFSVCARRCCCCFIPWI